MLSDGLSERLSDRISDRLSYRLSIDHQPLLGYCPINNKHHKHYNHQWSIGSR